MEVSLDAVRRVFRDVLEGQMTRKAADRWAYSLVKEFESGALTFAPPDETERIWAGVMYLYGIDAMEGPGEYLHTQEGIRAAMESKVGGA